MCDIKDDKDECLVELDTISVQEDGDHDKVEQDKDRFTSNDPPVDEGAHGHNQVEDAFMKEDKCQQTVLFYLL